MNGYWDKVANRRLARRRFLATVAASGASTALLAACGGDDGGSAGGATATPDALGEAVQGGRFGNFFFSSSNFNPVSNWKEGQNLSGQHVYDRPLSTRVDARSYVLEALESIEVASPTKVVMKLRQGLVYQNKAPVNGRPVKASDVVATQEYVKQLPNAYDRAWQVDFLQSAEAPDDRTVVLNLTKPDAYLTSANHLSSSTSWCIIPQEMLAALDTTEPVGSGPYQQAEAQVDVRYLYRRNPTYWGAAKKLPFIDERLMVSLNDNIALEAAFRSEQIHVWNVPASILSRLTTELGDRVRVDKTIGLGVFAWHLNMKKDHPWVRDQRIREALYRLTERQEFVDLVYNGEAVLQPGPIPAGLNAYQLETKDTASFYKVDVAQARQLLEAAGWDFNREIEVISSNTSPLTQTADEVWQNQLAKAGVKLTIKVLPFAEWLPNRIAKADYDSILNGSPADDTPARAMRLFHTDQKNQFGNFGLGDPAIDAMIEKSETTTDLEENVKLVKQIQMEVLKKYAPTYQILTTITNTMLNAKVQNYELNPATSPMYRTEMWMKSA